MLGCLLPFLAYEYGPQYVRDLWKRSDCKWEQFVVDGSVNEFVEQNVSKQIRSFYFFFSVSILFSLLSLIMTFNRFFFFMSKY